MQRATVDDKMFYTLLIGWMLLFCTLLHMGRGARKPRSQYRMHLYHSLISTWLTFNAFRRPEAYPEYYVVTCSLAYFVTDLNNMIFNDFVYKVEGYHGTAARVMEYVHHILSIGATMTCAFWWTGYCDLSHPAMHALTSSGPLNPLLHFTVADASTIPLMLWRRTSEQYFSLYTVFVVLFFATRIYYHLVHFLPLLFKSCAGDAMRAALTTYALLQIVAGIFVLRKWGVEFGHWRNGTKVVKKDPEDVEAEEQQRMVDKKKEEKEQEKKRRAERIDVDIATGKDSRAKKEE